MYLTSSDSGNTFPVGNIHGTSACSRIRTCGEERTMKHAHGLAIPTTLQDVCDPQRMALLVYDMQVGICSQIKTADKIVARVGLLLAAARETGMRLAFTRHLSLPKA